MMTVLCILHLVTSILFHPFLSKPGRYAPLILVLKIMSIWCLHWGVGEWGERAWNA